jgi:cell wall-associated NlpC family hydrolase
MSARLPRLRNRYPVMGRFWRLWLSGQGARIARLAAPATLPATAAGEDPDTADASARGTASELVLAFTAAFRWTPWSWTATDASSTSSSPGTPRRST